VPISALVNGEERVAPLLTDTEWQVLQEFHRSGGVKVSTSCCHAPATPVQVKGGYRYFNAPSCDHAVDTIDTIRLESIIAKTASNAGWSIRCNVIGGDKTRPWMVNVLATSPDGDRRIGFVISSKEPSVSDLGKYVIQSFRMSLSGIIPIFLFPSIPRAGLWRFVHEGKFITALKYVEGRGIIGGLDAQLYVEVALENQPNAPSNQMRIRSFKITTWAKRSETHPDDPYRFDCCADVSFLDEHIMSFPWEWVASSEVIHQLQERGEDMDELLLLSAEMCVLSIAISHFARFDGIFYTARDIALGLLIKTSGVGRINDIVDDFLGGGFKEKYYAVYPRFVYLVKRDILELKRKKGYVVARSIGS